MKLVVGIDEAGRGPIIGPLVMVALSFKEEDIRKLEWIGVKDSKLLDPQTREDLFERIRDIVHDFRIEVIEPGAIDLALNDPSTNLNYLEADTSARLVSELDADKVIVDCPSVNILSYKNYFLSKLKKKEVELLMEHKADLNHVVVAAASVVAKVIRDKQIEKLKKELGLDFGSGYMSDPKTQLFLENYYEEHSDLFRKSWQSFKKVREKNLQRSLADF